ncbi:CDP-alcohol phosphatidyltransferase family protein [Micromonospora sp. NBC_01655]|uniref:CDP-alcohol phosphatidyltransferase family protein n=1 Tax=Micromonospora sp. NBC_01655 TaxID=2975983 RepID=UPI00224FFFD6|nr:CDP-alcohol phosphatidyltransferase family protein [Micromonospora sp. NBC_01655]MCX4469323.1 CDP-alcohol phosphatidyltransferase family protein [Micromonospora sp. NBC_01655]
MHSATLAEPSRPSVADFHRVNRGGGLFSESISQWLGAVFALVAQRLGLRPTALSIANLVLGLAASVTVVALAGPVAAGDVPAWVVGLAALVGWQVAYSLDCADGQLARVTGQGSAAGARVDVLCDVAAQIALVAALSATAVAQRPETPAWLVAVFAGTWMVNLVTSVMQAGPNAASMVTSTSLPVRLAKLVRDYGAVIFVAGLVLAFAPALVFWVIVAFTIVNGGFLLASIAFSARASLR